MSSALGANATGTEEDRESGNAMARLFNTLLATFAAIALGFGCKRLKLVKQEEGDLKGLGFYTGQIALPLLVFKTVATAKIGDVDMSVILACTLGKLFVWVVTWVAAYFAYKASRSRGQQVLTASTFAFFTVASNDFAIGFPVVDALYGAYVDMGAYIAANAVVGSLFFVPATSALFSVGSMLLKSSAGKGGTDETDWFSTTRELVGDVVMNPVISFTLVGLLFKYFLGRLLVPTDNGFEFPSPLREIIQLFTSSFGISALFLTGASLRSATLRLWPMALVLMKVVVCAYASRFFAQLFSANGVEASSGAKEDALHDFPFLYGTIPSSSAPLIFAMQYDPEAADLLATAVLWGLVLSGPILFVTAIFLEDGAMPRDLISMAQLSVSAVSVACGCVIVVMLLLLLRDWGYDCPGRVLIMCYAMVALIYEASMVAFNPRLSTACAEYLSNWYAPIRIFLGTVQNTLRLIVLALLIMYVVSWSRKVSPKVTHGPLKAASIFGGCLAIALVVGFLLDPNTLLGVCSVPVARVEGGHDVLLRDLCWSVFLFGCFSVLTVCGVIRRWEADDRTKIPDEGSDGPGTSSEGSSNEEDAPISALAPTESEAWGCRPPRQIVRGLALYQMVVLLTQVTNTSQVVVLSHIKGSFAGMIVLEMVLEHGQLIVLLGSLLFDNSFVARLQLSAVTNLPDMILSSWRRQSSGMLRNTSGSFLVEGPSWLTELPVVA